jgi:hypothetical protein
MKICGVLLQILSVALLAACGAGSPGVYVPGPTPQLSVPGMQGTLDAFRDVPTTTAAFEASPDAVWTALVAVYDEMKIPVTGINSASHAIVSTDQRVSTIGGKRVLDYVDCVDSYGSSSSYDIYLTVLTMLRPDDSGGTLARTQVVATGKPRTSTNRVGCASSGTLEMAIAARVRQKLGLPAEND